MRDPQVIVANKPSTITRSGDCISIGALLPIARSGAFQPYGASLRTSKFYPKLFDAEPAKRRHGHVNFMVTEPPPKLILI
jgi:hypothetical protein